MAGEIEHIKGKGFDTNPQNINMNGRPKKGISLVNSQLELEGYSPASKSDIEINYMSLLNLPEDRIEKLSKDKMQPILIHILAKSILSGKGFDIIERMLDRGIGKTKQSIDANSSGLFNIIIEDYSSLTPKQLEEERKKFLD